MSERLEHYFDTIRTRDVDAVRALLEADPDLVHEMDPNCFNYRLLNYAGWMDHRGFVDLALEFGADLDAKSEFELGDWNATQHALNWGNRDIAAYLVERGATLDVHTAAGLGDIESLKRMLDADPGRVHERGGDGTFPLHFAASPDVAAYLLDRGAEIDAIDYDHHSTPAQWAANRRADVSRYLVSRGAEPDIFMAVCSGDVDWVAEIVAASPDAVNDRVTAERFPPPDDRFCSIYLFTAGIGDNATPLHAASARHFISIVEYLVEHGADVNARGAYDDSTPMHVAAWHNQVGALEALLAHGADININSGVSHKNTPLGWAVVAGAVDAVRYLIGRGAEMRDYYLRDCEHGIEGGHKDYAHFVPEHYEAIKEMLVEATGRDG